MLVWYFYSCGRHWSVCEVVFVPNVDAVVAVTVMHILLLELHVYMLRVMAMMVWRRERCG